MPTYRCPRCNIELSSDARFCPHCGFNQTNARMQKVGPPQAMTSKPAPVTPPSAAAKTDPATALPPTAQQRLQPDVKHVIPTSASPQGQANTVPPPASAILPVKTNTPPKPSGTYPPLASGQAVPPQAQLPDMPTQLVGPQREEPSSQARSPLGERAGDAELGDGSKRVDEDAAQGKGLSLTKRYMSEQDTRYQQALALNSALEQSPVRPPLPEEGMWGKSQVAPQPPVMQAGGPMTMARPPQMQPGGAMTRPPQMQPGGVMARPPEMFMGLDPFTGEGAESMIATSKAAEHWRQSWRDRQHDEAGPAVGITRGQAEVPEPLMAMQHSIARMRAIVIPKNANQQSGKNFVFWFTLVLLICIIGGLSAYVISTYVPSTQLAAQISGNASVSPTLSIAHSQKSTITAGQMLHVHGAYFGANHAITFILATTPLTTASPVQSSSKGAFDASVVIPATWLAGSYALQAQDNQSGLHAFLDLQILPGQLIMSNTTPLVLTKSAQPIATTGLTFKIVVGKGTSPAQRITVTNSTSTPVQWSVSTVAENNLNWLQVNDGKTGGTLDANGTDSVGISVSAIALASSTKPYLGSVIFTVNSTQAIVPVSLTVQDTALEVIVNPNPVIAYLMAGGTCQPVTLTLINLSNQVVTWNANPYAIDQSHIHLDNLTSDQGTLDPVGLPNNTKAIQITCIGAQAGEKLYHISVYYNGVPVNVPVSVRYP